MLRPAVVMAVIDGVLRELTSDSRSADVQRYRAELDKVDWAVGNLGRALADVGHLAPLLEQLRATRTKRDELAARSAC